MSLARKIFSNTAWQIFGKAATAVLGIVSIKYITNYLSRSAYGEYTTIYDYTALFAIIADFGLFTIAVREMAHHNEKSAIEKIVGNVLSIRTALAIVAFSLGIFGALLIPAYRNTYIPFGVIIVSIATIIPLIAGTMSSVLQFSLRMQWASVALAVGKLVTVFYIVATVVFLFPNDPAAGFPHLLYAWIGGGVFTLVITYFASMRVVSIHFQFDFTFWKEVLIKALPYGLALVLGTIYFRTGTVVLSVLGLKEQVGYYGVPLRFLEILQIVPHYFMNSVLPTLTLRLKEGSGRALRIVRYALNALACLGFPILVGGSLLAWPLTAAVSSPDFLTHRTAAGVVLGSDIALQILLVALMFTYLHVVLSYTLVAMGRQAELLRVNALAVAVNITLNITLAPHFGFIGSAVSAVVTEAVMLANLVWRVHRRMPGVWDFSFIMKTAFSAGIMGVVLFFLRDPINRQLFSKGLLILVPVGGLVFGLCMFFTKAISKEMIGLLKIKKGEPPQSEL